MPVHGGPNTVENGLVLALDAGDRNSYPGSGTTWSDLAGSNNGTLTNGPTFDSGNGGSISVDGTNDIITVNDNSSIDLTELTFSLWFNRGDILPLAPGDQQNFFIKGNSYNAPGGDQLCPAFQLFGPTGGGQYNWRHPVSGSGNIVPPSQILFANQWYNMTITHISTQTPIPYLNGVKQTDWVVTNPTAPLVPNNFQMSFAGDVNRPVDSRYASFNGKFAIFQMYNRALTEQEVLQNWNAQKGRFGL